MSNEQFVQLQSHHNAWTMYRAMVGIGLVCAVILVAVFRLTAPTIQHNKQQILQDSIHRLFPQAHTFTAYTLGPHKLAQRLANTAASAQFYAVHDAQSNLLGFAINVTAAGYQDSFQFIYAYHPDTQTINDYEILESRETPGLGSRIESDPDFLANFKNLPVLLNDARNALLHPLQVVKHGRKTKPWQIDTISGATISSTALAKAVARSTAALVPTLKQQQERFEHANTRQ